MWCQPARLRTHSSLLIGVLQIRAMTCGHQCKGHAQSRTRLQHGVDASNAVSVLASGSGIIPGSCPCPREEFLRARVIARSCGVAADGSWRENEPPRLKPKRWADRNSGGIHSSLNRAPRRRLAAWSSPGGSERECDEAQSLAVSEYGHVPTSRLAGATAWMRVRSKWIRFGRSVWPTSPQTWRDVRVSKMWSTSSRSRNTVAATTSI